MESTKDRQMEYNSVAAATRVSAISRAWRTWCSSLLASESIRRSHSSSLDLLASHYRRLDPISERHLGARLLRRGGSALIFAIIGASLGASDSTGRMSNDLVTPRRGFGRRVASALTRAMPSTVPASSGRCRCATPLEPVELDRSHRATPRDSAHPSLLRDGPPPSFPWSGRWLLRRPRDTGQPPCRRCYPRRDTSPPGPAVRSPSPRSVSGKPPWLESCIPRQTGPAEYPETRCIPLLWH